MMTIQEQLMYTTLRIECFDTNKLPFSIGTGFLLSRPVGESQVKLYLVSNKHILMAAESIAITFTSMKDGEPEHGTNLKFNIDKVSENVVGHPNPNVDVAVLECTGLFVKRQNQLFIKAVSYDMLSDFTESELNVAENVLFIGYPNNRYDIINNLPLVRQGLIASHPKYDYNGDPVFIIDAQVFPGSSGSPVYIDLTFENIKNGQVNLGQKKINLLGIVAQTMIRNNKLAAIPTGVQIGTQEVIGLGIVFKATAIKEIIDNLPTNN